MNANTILDNMLKMRADAIEKAGLVEFTLLSPSEAVTAAIEEAGGTIGSTHWEQWCNSDTCACNSHDPGQSSTIALIPKSWILQGWLDTERAALVFDFNSNSDSHTLLLIVPAKRAGLVYQHKERHYAATTHITYPREIDFNEMTEMGEMEYIQALIED